MMVGPRSISTFESGTLYRLAGHVYARDAMHALGCQRNSRSRVAHMLCNSLGCRLCSEPRNLVSENPKNAANGRDNIAFVLTYFA